MFVGAAIERTRRAGDPEHRCRADRRHDDEAAAGHRATAAPAGARHANGRRAVSAAGGSAIYAPNVLQRASLKSADERS